MSTIVESVKDSVKEFFAPTLALTRPPLNVDITLRWHEQPVYSALKARKEAAEKVFNQAERRFLWMRGILVRDYALNGEQPVSQEEFWQAQEQEGEIRAAFNRAEPPYRKLVAELQALEDRIKAAIFAGRNTSSIRRDLASDLIQAIDQAVIANEQLTAYEIETNDCAPPGLAASDWQVFWPELQAGPDVDGGRIEALRRFMRMEGLL